MLARLFEYHVLSALPAVAGRKRTKAEEGRLALLEAAIGSGATPSGRRRWPRVPVNRVGRLLGAFGACDMVVLDASVGGFRLACYDELEKDASLELDVRDDSGRSCYFPCTVVWTNRAGHEYGLVLRALPRLSMTDPAAVAASDEIDPAA